MRKRNAMIDEFLKATRIGMLGTLNEDGSPNLMPLWYEWDGAKLRMFSDPRVAKIRRLRADPRATVLAAEGVGVAEAWVSVEGTVEVTTDGAKELMRRLTERYYEPKKAEEAIKMWSQAESLALLELTPTKIKSIWGSWVEE